MRVLVLDIETTVQRLVEINEEGKEKKVIDNSPHNPKNRLVSCNWRKVDVAWTDLNDFTSCIHEDNHSVFYHNDTEDYDSPEQLQAALDWAEVVVAHNAKYDLTYLLEAGFRLPPKAYCTLIGEYILARGTREDLSLEDTAIRRHVTHKKSDLVNQYWEDGYGFEEIPLPIVLEYADADVLSCAGVYIEQLKDWLRPENESLNNIVELMNDMLIFIVEIERNGIAIDLKRLAVIKKDYEAELAQLEIDLQKIAEAVMGDTPINLSSGVDISKVVYSREVVDRELHRKTFNIGLNEHGKALFRPFMTPQQFANSVKTTTRKVYKTKAEHCFVCHGKGYIHKTTIKGELYKKPTKCKVCTGKGFLYLPTKEIAGLKLIPGGPQDASINGFTVDKIELGRLLDQAYANGNQQAIEFLTKKMRLNAVNTYLNSFVKGIERWTRANSLLHAGFNQCTTKTGRLSSSNPNFQNQPKGKKFPIRGAIVSRFEGGMILESDFSGLEFCIAGELSRDPQIIADIFAGKDIHRQTGSIIHQKPKEEVTKDERNEVKPHTFAPIYGATGAGKPPHIKKYYEEFFNIYPRHKEWQLEQMDAVIRQGKIRTPSGREYCFPGTRRIKGGKTTNATMIVNYPVQGFATGDIVPLACIRALRRFRELGLRSLLILTVHDSIVVDVFPGELNQVCEALYWAMTEITSEIKQRWKYDMLMPLKCEMAVGRTWMDGETIHRNDNGEWSVST